MPSTSKKQHNFMAAVAHNPAFAKKAGVPQSVGKDFNEADKGRKFSKGGDMKSENMMMKKEGRGKMKSGGMATKMGAVKTSSKPDGIAMKGKTKGTMVKMARGGKAC